MTGLAEDCFGYLSIAKNSLDLQKIATVSWPVKTLSALDRCSPKVLQTTPRESLGLNCLGYFSVLPWTGYNGIRISSSTGLHHAGTFPSGHIAMCYVSVIWFGIQVAETVARPQNLNPDTEITPECPNPTLDAYILASIRES